MYHHHWYQRPKPACRYHMTWILPVLLAPVVVVLVLAGVNVMWACVLVVMLAIVAKAVGSK
jgi:hypothetical protein